jgi:hypothetical protein
MVTSGPSVWFMVVAIPFLLLQLPVAVIILMGAIKMRRLEMYGLAVTASIVAMLPCHPGFLVGLPIGLWSLMVLLRPETKAAFDQHRAERLADVVQAADTPAAVAP